MKTYLFTALLFLTNCTFAQIINRKYIDIEPAKIVATYNQKSQPDSTNPSLVGNTKFLLFIGDNISNFLSSPVYTNDTATRRFSSVEQLSQYFNAPSIPKTSYSYIILKKYPKGKITFIQHIPSETYKFEEDINLFEWKLTGDTSTVCGYKVQKATCEYGGRSWIAWFSPEIPYSDGPYKFNGLPGLIVKVYDTRNHYEFELQSINKLEPGLMMDIEDKAYILTTKENFFRAEDYFRADIISRAKEAGLDQKSQQAAAKSMSVRNNPLELKRK